MTTLPLPVRYIRYLFLDIYDFFNFNRINAVERAVIILILY